MKQKRSGIILIISFFFSSYMYCQNSEIESSSSILSFTDKIIIKTTLDAESFSSYAENNENDSARFLSAYTLPRLVLSLDYEFIGVSIALPTGSEGNKISNYNFLFFLGNWTQGFQYKKIKGDSYGDFSSTNFDPLTFNQEYPNFKTSYWGGSTSYIVNPNFSLRNAVYNTEWQRKSAGSYIPTLNYGFSTLNTESNGVDFYMEDFTIEFVSSYYYTWVIRKNWFVSPFLAPSAGVQFSKEVTKETTKKTYFPLSLAGGLQLGYVSRKVIFGLSFDFKNTVFPDEKFIVEDTGFSKLYVGYRITPPKRIKKSFDWMTEKLGIKK